MIEEEDLVDFLDARFQGCQELADAFPGGIHAGRAEDGSALPYLVVNVVGEVPTLHTEEDTAEGTVVRFAAFAPTRKQARSLARLIARQDSAGLDRIANQPLAEGGAVVTAIRIAGATVLYDDPASTGGEAWMGMLTYHFLLTRS